MIVAGTFLPCDSILVISLRALDSVWERWCSLIRAPLSGLTRPGRGILFRGRLILCGLLRILVNFVRHDCLLLSKRRVGTVLHTITPVTLCGMSAKPSIVGRAILTRTRQSAPFQMQLTGEEARSHDARNRVIGFWRSQATGRGANSTSEGPFITRGLGLQNHIAHLAASNLGSAFKA